MAAVIVVCVVALAASVAPAQQFSPQMPFAQPEYPGAGNYSFSQQAQYFGPVDEMGGPIESYVTPASCDECCAEPCGDCCSSCGTEGCDGGPDCTGSGGSYFGPMRRGYGFLIRSGPVFNLGHTFFEESKVGWTIQGAGRTPLGLGSSTGYFFGELGGSYLSADGLADERSTPGSITITTAQASTSIYLDDFYRSALTQIRRGSLDGSIGWHGAPNAFIQFDARWGGRVGHVHGYFANRNSEDLQDLIDIARALGANVRLTPDYSNTDTFAGMFVAFAGEVMLSRGGSRNPDIRLGFTSEFANDWIDFHHYEDASLMTASCMAHLIIGN
jgi:hypothetical protein